MAAGRLVLASAFRARGEAIKLGRAHRADASPASHPHSHMVQAWPFESEPDDTNSDLDLEVSKALRSPSFGAAPELLCKNLLLGSAGGSRASFQEVASESPRLTFRIVSFRSCI